MSDPRVPLKNPFLAAVLAFLIPGAGHFYQGRTFKALIYSLGILGMFFYGMHLAEWKAVYLSVDPPKRNLGYYAQVCTGLPALSAVVQARRYTGKDEKTLSEPLSARFEGHFIDSQAARPLPITGQLELKPGDNPGETVSGIFQGTTDTGAAITLKLDGDLFKMAPKVGGTPGRSLECEAVQEEEGGGAASAGRIRGDIPRPFFDWFEAPLDDDQIQEINRRLGKRYELALVYTWIAGLLNILAIWDAMEGPAYGYGDEEDEDDERDKKKRNEPKEQPAAKLEAAAKT